MGWSTNQKAQAKRDQQNAKKKQQAQKRQEQKQSKKWKDSETQKKYQADKQKQDKRNKEIARKKQLKELAQQQQRQMEKINRKKEKFTEKKLTQAEIAKNVQERQMKIEKNSEQNQAQYFYQENPNKKQEEQLVAGTVQQALNILDLDADKHPQKRFKAAFEVYCNKRDGQIRVDYPKLKRSQRLQMMHKQFEKHPDNPFNKKTKAYNDKPAKEEQNNEQKE